MTISVNTAPTVTGPNAVNGAAGTAIALAGLSVFDPDVTAGSQTLTVQVQSDPSGTLAVGSGTGAAVTPNVFGGININGTLAQINAALASLTVTSPTVGSFNVSVLAQDSLGALSPTQHIAVTTTEADIILSSSGQTAIGSAAVDIFDISAPNGTAIGLAGNDIYNLLSGNLKGISIVEVAGAAGGTADSLVIGATLAGGMVATGPSLPANIELLSISPLVSGLVTFVDLDGIANSWNANWTVQASDANRLIFDTGAGADAVNLNLTITGQPDSALPLAQINSGPGNDIISISLALANATAPLTAGLAPSLSFIAAATQLGAEIHAGAGNDRVTGSDFADRIFGEAGNDLINVGGGNDFIEAGPGVDVVHAGAGDDIMKATLIVGGNDGNDGNDFYFGDAGFDTIDYSALTRGITVEMRQVLGTSVGQVEGAQPGQDVLSSIEHVIGTQAADRFVDAGGNNVYTGGAGADRFVFKQGFGHDTITDFTITGTAHDVIALDHDLFAHVRTVEALLASAQVSEHNGSVVIAADAHDTLTLQGVSLADLRAHHDAIIWA